MLYYLPVYYEVAKGFSPTEAGVALFPVTFTTAPAAVVVGLVIAKTDKYRPSVVSGCIVFIA
jgi:Na+/melibiose symporter-like transporter